jgi:hypothetical protein
MEARYTVHIILLGFFLGLVLIFGAIDFLKPTPPVMALPPGYFALGVVDMSADSSVNVASLEKGEDAVLVINRKWKGKLTTDFSYYDGNHDGLVTLDDSVYPYLELFYYSTGETHPISVSGIRAIKIISTGNPSPTYRAIFSDDSTRMVRAK